MFGKGLSQRTVHVVMATPLGQGGKGGIDRIVDELRQQSRDCEDDIRLSFLTTRGQRHIGLSGFYLGASTAELLARRLVGQVDVLHVNLSSHGSTWRKILLCAAARAAGIPYIIHLHGSRYQEFLESAGPVAAGRIKGMFRGAATVLVLGEVWRAFLIRHMPDIAHRIRILPNASRAPAQPNDLSARPAVPATILFLGRVGERKGVPVLVDALSQLPADGSWRAIIAGDGNVDGTRDTVEQLGMADRVTLTGWVGPADVEGLLRTADILVLPSFNENLPMSVIEGMSYGLTVVATPVGAVEDIIEDGVTGLLVPVGDAARLSAALGRAVADPALRARLGHAARLFHRDNLDIAAYFSQLKEIWRQTATPRGTGRLRDAVL